MPITFGIYDFFSYTVPGVLYILILNELARVFRLPSLEVNQLGTSLGSAAIWLVLAYVSGHLMDTFAIAWYSLFNKFSAETKAMHDFKHKNDNLEIRFNLDDRRILHSVIRHNKPDVVLSIDSYKAISIMLNNISLALFLLGIIELIRFTLQGYPLSALAFALAAFVFSYVAVKRSRLFNEWHWSAVFAHARQFGRSVPEMYKMKENDAAEKEEKAPLTVKHVKKMKKHPEAEEAEDKKSRLN